MIQLITPCEEYLPSYQEAYDEYISNGVTTYSFYNPREVDVLQRFDHYRKALNLKPGYVTSDYYWLVDEEKKLFIGQIALRPELNEKLRLIGGNIGYGVRYSCWNQGYGTMMLSLVLEKAKERGLTRILCTCNDDNPASARVMEHNGFQLEDRMEVDGTLIRHYWKDI